jgi:hypothetical protein
MVSGDESMKKAEEPGSPEVRWDVGARNPFPRAEAILLERKVIKGPVRWSELPAEEARHLLEEAFGTLYEMPEAAE